VSPLLALLHWPDFGGTTAGSSDSDTSGEISPEEKALVLINTGACKLGKRPFVSKWSLPCVQEKGRIE